jgi:hypothetical protein
MMAEYARWQAEFAGMKNAFITLHNQQRECITKLDALTVQNAAILAVLAERDGAKSNGEIRHVNGGGSETEPLRNAAD